MIDLNRLSEVTMAALVESLPPDVTIVLMLAHAEEVAVTSTELGDNTALLMRGFIEKHEGEDMSVTAHVTRSPPPKGDA